MTDASSRVQREFYERERFMADQVSEFDWGRMRWLASEALGKSGGLSMARMVLYPGQSNDVHRHPNCEEAL